MLENWDSLQQSRSFCFAPSVFLTSAMAVFDVFKLLFLLSLLSSSWWQNGESRGTFPPTCTRIECPEYDLIHAGNDYEIRRYNSTLWMSTSPIQDISFVQATRKGFLQLFDYIQGKNSDKKQIEMTAPVLTEIFPSDGPFCASSFVVSFYVPKANQADPPSAKGLHAQRWQTTYAAVRQFSGYVTDSDVGTEAAALKDSIAGTVWSDIIYRSRGANTTSVYTVAQYNSPFEYTDRVNEIWMPFTMREDEEPKTELKNKILLAFEGVM